MTNDFHAVAIPEPTTILGVRLRPLSLGHIIILGRVKSSFVTQGESTTLDDLALSVLICSLTYKRGVDLFNRTDLPRLFRRWHRKLIGRLWWKQTIDYQKKAEEFAEYIKRGSEIPNYAFRAEDFTDMNCPSVQIVKVAMMRDLHIPEAELMDRSWAMCLWDYVTLKAMAGQVQMVDGDAIASAQAVADRLAEKFNGGTQCQ